MADDSLRQESAYSRAGVSIEAGDALVERIKPMAARTMRPEVLAGIGGFGSCFSLGRGYKDPILVSGTDGVGTKLKVAFAVNKHDTVGIDCVAMCVNDILAMGAEPLFFLDYFATGRLNVAAAADVIKGITEGCCQAGCALVGGETAEMPGLYADGEYDLAGFAVGVADKEQIVDGSRVKPGDALVGLASSGVHSNGFSLVRKIVSDRGWLYESKVGDADRALGEELLTPTRIYVRAVLELRRHFNVRAMAHITGGGLLENVPRVLPEGCEAVIRLGSWPVPDIFSLLRGAGGVEPREMYRVFNMGIGFAVVLPAEEAEDFVQAAEHLDEHAYVIGSVQAGSRGVVLEGLD
jgi:phosphoribosylformylglycinamidine cyclo-ligase